jgi:hypothetical protein
MPTYKIEGADATTGEPGECTVEADDEEQAALLAREKGLLTSSATEVSEPRYAASDEVFPPYSALNVFATITTIVGVLSAVGGMIIFFVQLNAESFAGILSGVAFVGGGVLMAGLGECMGIARKYAIKNGL